MPSFTSQPEPPDSPIRLHEPSPTGPDHYPEEDLAFIRIASLAVSDRYVSREIPREHREILVARAAVALVRDGGISIEKHPDPEQDWKISWDPSAIARSLGIRQDGDSERDREDRAKIERAGRRTYQTLAGAQGSNAGGRVGRRGLCRPFGRSTQVDAERRRGRDIPGEAEEEDGGDGLRRGRRRSGAEEGEDGLSCSKMNGLAIE